MVRLRTLVFALGTASSAWAHAVLLEGSPQAGAQVRASGFPVRLRFNSRVDARRSRVAVVEPGGKERALVLAGQSSPDTIASEVTGAKPGLCRIRWQVLSSDGHITRGELQFHVQ